MGRGRREKTDIQVTRCVGEDKEWLFTSRRWAWQSNQLQQEHDGSLFTSYQLISFESVPLLLWNHEIISIERSLLTM